MKIHLKNKELVAGERDAGGLTVYCLDDVVWLTPSGDLNDHLILSGASFAVSCKGNVVMLALNSATLILKSVTQNIGMACHGKALFYKIADAIAKSCWMRRCSIGQS